MSQLGQIAEMINVKAESYNVGDLQRIRKDIKGLSRLPSSSLFDKRTVFKEWGWHYGGRKELQFNIGIEGGFLRYGVAFSLERSQTLPSIDVLIPKIALFNEYLTSNNEDYLDLKMWHYDSQGRSKDYMPTQIPTELVREGVFIFFGEKQLLEDLNYDLILKTLDRLLPLYISIESSNPQKSLEKVYSGFDFKPGCSIKPSSTTASFTEKTLNVRLKHNDYQYQLYQDLVEIYGEQNVGTEINTNGKSIDLVAKNKGKYYFYEIKTASTAKGCIRQALGQILEYSFWSDNQQADRLIIVGKALANKKEEQYIDFLRSEFNLPIEYYSIDSTQTIS